MTMTLNSRKPIRAGDTVSDDDVRRIFEGVIGRTLPRPEWTHPAHLVFATALLAERGLTAAEAAAPTFIRTYNESVGGVNDDTQGYHHTITLFFLRHIERFLAQFPEAAPGTRATRLLSSDLARPDYPLRYYTKSLLFSVEARRNWIEPDLAPDDATITF